MLKRIHAIAKKITLLAKKDIPVPSWSDVLSYLKKIAHIPCTTALFILIIFLPIIQNGITFFTDIDFSGDLSGYFDAPQKIIDFSPRAYANRDFQKKFEKRFNTEIPSRERYIRLYNQIQFSFFRLTPNRIIGENTDLFELSYIDAECGLSSKNDFSILENFKELEDYANHLQSIQSKLHKIGKHFIFYTTPSKATYKYNDIPLKYRLKKKSNYKTPYFYLKELITSRNINYIDSRDYISNDSFPVFYTTGIHWARPIEQRISQAIVEKMRVLSNQNLPRIILKDIKSSKRPFRRDADLFLLANIISKPSGTFYEYKTSIEKDQNFSTPKFLIQGGSFSEGFYSFDYYAYSNESYKFFYDKIFRNKDSQQPMQSWEDINFSTIFNNVDFIIIELNEAVILNYSNGFVKFLDSFLDSFTNKTATSAG